MCQEIGMTDESRLGMFSSRRPPRFNRIDDPQLAGRWRGSAGKDSKADRESGELGDTSGILCGEDDGNKLA